MHRSAILNEIETKKQSHEKILQEIKIKTVCLSKFDPRAKLHRQLNSITNNDLDILADATSGKCGIKMLSRKHNVRPNPYIDDVSSCIEVTTIQHTETQKSIYDLVDEYKHLDSNWEEFNNESKSFLMKLDKIQAAYICEQTKNQSNCDDLYKYRQEWITALILHEVVLKVSEIYEIKNPGKVKTILSNIYGQKNNFKSKATVWGKKMIQLLTKNISNLTPKTTKNSVL